MTQKLDSGSVGKDSVRDAIHVAIYPTQAKHTLFPSQRANIYGTTAGEIHGIVDPFLSEPVEEDEWFWLWITPNTVTGMTHTWDAPFLNVGYPDHVEANNYIDWFAKQCNVPREILINAAHRWAKDKKHTFLGSNDEYTMIRFSEWDKFWESYKVVFGTVPEDTSPIFRCSC